MTQDRCRVLPLEQGKHVSDEASHSFGQTWDRNQDTSLYFHTALSGPSWLSNDLSLRPPLLAPTSLWGFFCCIHAVFYAIPQGMSEKVGLGLSLPLSAHPPVTPSLPHGAEGAVSLSIHSVDLPDLSTPCSPALQNAAFTGLQLS